MESFSLPHQLKGGSTGILVKKEMPTRHEAILLYQLAIQRLLLVNDWSSSCQKVGKFYLCDSTGAGVQQIRVGEGLLIKVHLQEGEDESLVRWLRITEVFQEKDLLRDEELTGFSTLPICSPFGTPEQKVKTAEEHTFYIMRRTSRVTAYVNELPEPGASRPQRFFKQALQLTMVFGNLLGFSKAQWRCLLVGLLEKRTA
jgi:hypothetical protein